jgi:hypothetical protein
MKHYLKIIGYGAIIWAVAFIVACIFVGFKVSSQVLVQGVTTLAVLIIAFLFAENIKISKIKTAVIIGLLWVATGAALDALITTRFTGWIFFCRWEMWLGYLFIFLVPLVVTYKNEKLKQ